MVLSEEQIFRYFTGLKKNKNVQPQIAKNEMIYRRQSVRVERIRAGPIK